MKKLKIALALLFIIPTIGAAEARNIKSKYINRFPVQLADFEIEYIIEDLDLGGYREAEYSLKMSPRLSLGHHNKDFYFHCGTELKGREECERILASLKKYSHLTFDLWENKSLHGRSECIWHKGILILPSVFITFKTASICE